MQSVDVTDESKMFTLKLTYKHTLPDVVKKMRIYFSCVLSREKLVAFSMHGMKITRKESMHEEY